MYNLKDDLDQQVKEFFTTQYDLSIDLRQIQWQPTRDDFEGEITLVVFPFVKLLKIQAEEIAQAVGFFIQQNLRQVSDFNVVKGFLNLKLSDVYTKQLFEKHIQKGDFLRFKTRSETVLVEYSSPNTNKPLHLGHLRNIFLGDSVAKILTKVGYDVKRVQVINDRGIHICKSMLAWQKYGNGETPETSGLKGDHLVGKYYVKFDEVYKSEVAHLIGQGIDEKTAKLQAPILLEAQATLRKWEASDPSVVALWEKMNTWVYAGFSQTYHKMRVAFDKLYYESETYLKGKSVAEEGLSKNVFYRKEDGSVWIDLKEKGLDEKIILRSDGTAVYMTQDIGTAIQRFEDFPNTRKMVYTVGNEQDYHFKVLFLILEALGYDFARNCFHLSYGMVDLPSGKMKSREGTVVDADDLIESMFHTAKEKAEELGKLDEIAEDDKQALFQKIGLAAIKYYILKVDPKKRMLFNPEESIDFNGNTGPFIQYAYARIQALLRRGEVEELKEDDFETLDLAEKKLVLLLFNYRLVVEDAANHYSPALVANYVYDLVKAFNYFYQNVNIFKSEVNKRSFRILLSKKVGEVIEDCMGLLGVEVPDRM